MELRAKQLDYFLQSNKSNINQKCMCQRTCTLICQTTTLTTPKKQPPPTYSYTHSPSHTKFTDARTFMGKQYSVRVNAVVFVCVCRCVCVSRVRWVHCYTLRNKCLSMKRLCFVHSTVSAVTGLCTSYHCHEYESITEGYLTSYLDL